MINWTASMKQSFEYYIVDPNTWRDSKKIDCVISSSIVRDSSAETLGSATFEVTEELEECYIRVYAVITQDGTTSRVPLGTYLVQTPSYSFNGHYRSYTVDAYTPLLELKEKPIPLGYTVFKDANIMTTVCARSKEHMRGPVVDTTSSNILYEDFVANTDDTWMSYLSDLVSKAKYKYGLDAMGNVIFEPVKDVTAMQPVWTYTDDNSSILYPSTTLERDLYGIPNVVEVVYSNGLDYFYSRVENNDVDSPISIKNRGREILQRVVNPSDLGNPTQAMIDEYAKDLLKTYSTLEYTVSYSHGYCPVRVGDCVRINYTRAGLNNVKALVIYQTINCKPGMEVQEKAVYTLRLWEG